VSQAEVRRNGERSRPFYEGMPNCNFMPEQQSDMLRRASTSVVSDQHKKPNAVGQMLASVRVRALALWIMYIHNLHTSVTSGACFCGAVSESF
jgi:hypothetical protein